MLTYFRANMLSEQQRSTGIRSMWRTDNKIGNKVVEITKKIEWALW